MGGKNIGDLLNAAGVTWGSFMGGFDLTVTNSNGTTGCVRSSTLGGHRDHGRLHSAPCVLPVLRIDCEPEPHAGPVSVSEIGHDGRPITSTTSTTSIAAVKPELFRRSAS